MQKLEAEGASDMSISLSEGVLSVGGESYQLDAVPEEGSFDVVREHGSKMCNVGAVRERIHIKQTLSSAGRAQIKQRTEQAERDAHGHTALMLAACYGNTESVHALLAARANVEAADMNGSYTALIRAAANGYTECVRALVAGRASVNAAMPLKLWQIFT